MPAYFLGQNPGSFASFSFRLDVRVCVRLDPEILQVRGSQLHPHLRTQPELRRGGKNPSEGGGASLLGYALVNLPYVKISRKKILAYPYRFGSSEFNNTAHIFSSILGRIRIRIRFYPIRIRVHIKMIRIHKHNTAYNIFF